MTVIEMKEIVEAINLLKSTLNDDQAKIVKMLYPKFEDLKKNFYTVNVNDFKVNYNGELYKILVSSYQFDENSNINDTSIFKKL